MPESAGEMPDLADVIFINKKTACFSAFVCHIGATYFFYMDFSTEVIVGLIWGERFDQTGLVIRFYGTINPMIKLSDSNRITAIVLIPVFIILVF